MTQSVALRRGARWTCWLTAGLLLLALLPFATACASSTRACPMAVAARPYACCCATNDAGGLTARTCPNGRTEPALLAPSTLQDPRVLRVAAVLAPAPAPPGTPLLVLEARRCRPSDIVLPPVPPGDQAPPRAPPHLLPT